MGFFDDPGDARRGYRRPEEQQAVPGRIEPPEGWALPTLLPWVRVLGQSDSARIALVGLRCWPEGVSLDVHVLRRFAPPVPRADLGFPPERDDWPFRFGLRFADGRRAVAPGRFSTPARPGEVSLSPRGGHGGRFHRRYDFYLWPLPPAGRLILVAEWTSEKIRETYTELDAGEIRSGSARAKVVWSDLPRGSGEAATSSTSSTNSTSASSTSTSAGSSAGSSSVTSGTRTSSSFATSFSASTTTGTAARTPGDDIGK